MKLWIALLILILTPPWAYAAGTGLPWASGFESNDFSEWADHLGEFEITNDAPRSGSYCLQAKLTQDGSDDNKASFYFGDHVLTGGDKVTSLYLELSTKFSAGYTQWPETAHHIALLAITDGRSAQDRFQVVVAVNSEGAYMVRLTAAVFQGPVTLSQNGDGGPVQVREGRWDDLKLNVRLNRPGLSDGIVKLWVNDTLRIEYKNLNIRQETTYGLNRLSLSSLSVPAGRADGYQYYDGWRLYTISAPTGLRIMTTPK